MLSYHLAMFGAHSSIASMDFINLVHHLTLKNSLFEKSRDVMGRNTSFILPHCQVWWPWTIWWGCYNSFSLSCDLACHRVICISKGFSNYMDGKPSYQVITLLILVDMSITAVDIKYL